MIGVALILALASAPKPVTVGVLRDGSSPDDARYVERFSQEIEALTADDFAISFPPEKNVEGAWTLGSVEQQLDVLLADPKVDVVLAMGLIASHVAGRREALPKPVVAPFIVDPKVQGIPFEGGTSGRKNFTYVASPAVFGNDLRAFEALVGFRKAAVLLTAGFRTAVPELKERSDAIAKELGVELVPIEVGAEASEAIASLPDDIDAVYLGILVRLAPGELDAIVKALIERRLPSFSMRGGAEVERGILAGVSAGLDIDRIARRVALDVQRILLGEDAAKIDVSMARKERLSINMATARAIGFSPSWTTLTEAELVNPARETAERSVTIREAADRAVEANLDLLANARSIEAGAAEVRKARAGLLPSLDLQANAVQIDADRASASFGATAERQITVGGRLSQVIFADGAWANFTINEHLQRSREYQRRALVLDVVQQAAVAYLDLLRAKAYEQIQRDNLDVTRSNMELAQVRVSIGAANRSETYRWESELAQSRGRVIAAVAQRNAAEIALNRVMNRPLEEPFVTESNLENPTSLEPIRALFAMLDNPRAFRAFRGFMSENGIEAAPELSAIDAGIAATERGLTSVNRSFYVPDFVLQGAVDQIVLQDGAGSGDSTAMIPPALAAALPNVDSTTWSLAIGARIPIFSGLERYADLARARAQIAQQRTEREAVAQRIEQRIRSAIHIAGASYANIELSRTASRAARQNLELVRDAYARGALSYLNLIDAQNAALVAESVAASAVYDFLVDFVAVERAVSRYGFRDGPDENAAWMRRLEKHLAEGEAP